MIYQHLLDGIARFGASREEICLHTIGVHEDLIQERVILAPWWEPSTFGWADGVTFLSPSDSASIKVWNVYAGGCELTYIKTGIGAPVMMEAALALGLTPCKKAVFVGSVGALDERIGIGDIVVPEHSVCGDGASRYLSGNALQENDPFGKKSYPDRDGFERLVLSTARICAAQGVKWHIGHTFSVDTVFAQFAHLDEILSLGCNTIEMETAAAFRAASLAGVSLTALFSVSDNTIERKSLLGGRTAEENDYRKEVRRIIFPRILLDVLSG